MTITDDGLGTFANLARALGILGATKTNDAWFGDPLGGSLTNPNGLKTVLADDTQRQALIDFVDEVLGPPEEHQVDHQQWVPLFRETTPDVVVYAVLEPVDAAVRIGVAAEYATGATAPFARVSVHVPIFQVPRAGGSTTAGSGQPTWLFLGQQDARIELGVEATFTSAPVVPGQAHVGGAKVKVGIPTLIPGDTVDYSLTLVDLQLPGAMTPTSPTLSVDSADDVGPEVFEFVVGMVRQQVSSLDLTDDAMRHIAGLAGILGLRDVPNLPALPLADLPEHGLTALVEWLGSLVEDDTHLDAWLGELARLVGGTARPARNAVEFSIGPATLFFGLDVAAGTGGQPVLRPWVELAWSPSSGAEVGATVHLLRADTGTGQVTAIPSLQAHATFGELAPGGGKLLTGTPAVGSLRVGIGLDEHQRPVFALTVQNVDLPGSRHYDLLDLSSPEAALDAANTVIGGALSTALDGFGDVGTLLKVLLGIDPPGAIQAVAATEMLADPLGALRGYWTDVVADGTAMAEVVGTLSHLLTGTAQAITPAAGSEGDPWRLDLVDGVGLAFWRDGSTLCVGLGAHVLNPVLDDLMVAAAVDLDLLRVDLSTGRASFASSVAGTVDLRPRDGNPLSLDLSSARILFHGLGVRVAWRAGVGLRVAMAGAGLEIDHVDARTGVRLVSPVPLPSIGPDGSVVFAPDWAALESILAVLLGEANLPALEIALELLGWRGGGAHLSLGSLIANPATAMAAWATDLALDCAHVRTVLGPVAVLLSGGRLGAPLGSGRPDDPYRCPVAGEPHAPGLAVWTVPGCPPVSAIRAGALPVQALLDGLVPPTGAEMAARLQASADSIPDLGDLLFARGHLGDGLTALMARLAGTDGVVAPSTPTGVTARTLAGHSYGSLSHSCRATGEALVGVSGAVAAVVQVGTGSAWLNGVAAGAAVDATVAIPVPLPASGNGTWFVRVPDPPTAAASRSDHDAVQAQADALATVLRSRTSPVVLVAHGAGAAAALRAAAVTPMVSAVVTVGAPWTPVSVLALTTGLSGDALRFLDDLAGPVLPAMPDDALTITGSQFWRGAALVRRAREVARATDLPSCATESIRSGLAVHAIFGSVDVGDVGRAIAALLVGAVQMRQDQATRRVVATTGLPTELHAGIDLPIFDLDLAGLTVGFGARVDLLSIQRTNPTIHPLRQVTATLQLGVTDGWLVGGPGALQNDIEARWAEIVVGIPLDGGEGSCEIVLHDAHAYAAFRERWVVHAGADGVDATAVLPEIRIILSEIVGRLRVASPPLASLLTTLGIIRSDGLDPSAIDRLVHDPATTLLPVIRAAAVDLATDLRGLLGMPTTGLPATAVRIGNPMAYVDVDLATGGIQGTATLALADVPTVGVTVTAGAGAPSLQVTVGTFDTQLGGVRFVASAGTGGPTAAVEELRPRSAATTRIPVYPTADVDGLSGLLGRLLPATLAQALANWCRGRATDAGAATLDAGLLALGLLGPASEEGSRAVILPVGLFTDPGAWLLVRADPLAAVVAVLEALAPVVVPTRALGVAGWPLYPELTITYAIVAGRLELAAVVELDATIDGRDIGTRITAGVSISAGGEVVPIVSVAETVDQTGLVLRVAPGQTPPVTLSLVRAAPAAPIMVYPAGAGIGPAIGAAAGTVVRVVLNEVVSHRNDGTATDLRAVARTVHELGTGLDLLVADQFTDAKVTTFAEHPDAVLLARLPNLVTSGLTALVQALDPTGTKVSVDAASGGVRRINLGAGRHVHLTLDGTTPAIEFGCDIAISDRDANVVGRFVVEKVRLTPTGVQVSVRGGPFSIPAGPLVLRPEVVVRAGVTTGGFTRLVGVGLALDPNGDEALECRWAIDGSPPYLAGISRDLTGEHEDRTAEAIGLRVLGLGVSIVASVVTSELGTVVTPRATRMLQGVLFTGGDPTLDPAFFTALGHPEALLDRVKRLAWNAATDTSPLSLTIDSTVTVGLAHKSLGAGREALGINVTLVPGKRFAFPTSGIDVALEVDATWITGVVQPGLAIYALEGTIDHLDLEPAFSIMGIGMRFTKSSGPLLDLGSIQLDGIAFHVYAEATSLGVGGGANLELVGLGVAPGGGGNNGVANNIMNDVGSSSANNRPVFSPSLALQKHPGPGQGLGVSLRAGEPPGPWWIVIQRQLGPLYVDRIGLNTVEAGGRVTEISLLFNGQLSLFGMTAAVDRLSITWHGGDVLSITSWSVDLMGLAISADMAGLMLAGGLLKTDDGGSTGYVGMLMGRFAAYGLSVFGGYTNDKGNASFFVFGAINGPIGGPPAFFLTGLGGGLGINRGLVIPEDISQFGTFPFIQALDPGAKPPAHPMDELHRLSSIFPHQMGNFWFAAGISFTCFSLVDGVAVVAVSFGNGLEINLLGLARLALPRPGAALVSIELALLARFSTREGVFMIKAQLTDNSWLLTESIRLTGGFAFAIWWKGPLAGQFVLTMGGYHPSFHREGYPDVPRLGIMWRISDYLVIKGGSYFALTSEALMAGTSIDASLDLGFVWANLSFGADGIVYFDPFWFEVSAYCRISAGINLDLGLFTISFSITLGATIKVWGPDFAGRAEFEIGPCTIPVEFGSPRKVKGDVLLWPAFIAKYLEDAAGQARALSSITGKGTLPSATGGDTAAPSADGTRALPFRVFAEFELTFVTTIPTQQLVIGTARPPALGVTLPDGRNSALALSPMNATKLTSTLTISLELLDPATYVARTTADDGKPLAEKLARLAERWGEQDAAGPSTDAFPIGVWGDPQPANLPVKPLPTGDVIRSGNGMRLVAGVDMPQVGPDIDYYQVEAARRPLPLLATGTDRAKFLNVSAALPGTSVATAAAALTLAAERIFADRGTGETRRVRGGHSAIAAASFAGERAAPPLFGTLTDGLAKVNGADGTRTDQAAPEVPIGREPRRPFVAGYLTGGAGAAIRPTVTTVSDGRLKRRPAPTVESVSGRLGLHLPLSLTRSASPGVVKAGTVLASGYVPRTDAVGAMGEYAGGRLGNVAVQNLVTGLGAMPDGPRSGSRRRRPKADPLASTVRSGDLVVLQLPDARTDTEEDRRPALAVGGKARVTIMVGNRVLADDDVVDQSVTIGSGATHIAVHADGDVDPNGGWAGWHLGGRVARLGTQAAVAAGCIVTVDTVSGGPVLAWDNASAVVADAEQVVTRFSRPVSTVAISLTGSGARNLDPTQLVLIGGQIATRHGAPIPPTAVTLGDTNVLVYAITPDPDATSITVKILVGGDWSVSGVVGCSESQAAVADDIARDHLAGVTAKLLAVQGPGVTLTWQDPPAPQRPRSPRTPTAPRTPAALAPEAPRTAAPQRSAITPHTAASPPAPKKPRKASAPARRRTR